MKEIIANSGETDWQEANDYPSGAFVKVLHEGSDSAPRSILLKIEPGWKMTEHAHVYTEIHYILEGDYQTNDKIYSTGTFRVIPKHANHGPFTTQNGAIVLVMWIKDENE